MRTISWRLILAVLLACASTSLGAEAGPVFVVPLRSEVSSAQFYFLRRALKEAERQDASAIVIDMETYGGEMTAAVNNMDALLKTRVPTVTYINNKAISAGALIAMATQRIYMSPTAIIGAAAPVLSTGEDLPTMMKAKSESAFSAIARAAAQRHGHNPELADAFIRKEKELKIGDETLDGPATILTLSAQEAAREFNGKPLLAAGIAPTLDAALKLAGLGGEVHRVEPSGFERMAIWITALAPLLLIGGIVGAWIEFKTPGFGVPGAVSAICFALFFTGHYLAGLAGWEVIVLFALGIVLVLSELLLHPGTVLPGVAGVVLMFGALVWAMIDRWPSQPFWPTTEMLVRPLINLGIAGIVAAVAIYALAKVLPRTSFYRRIVLAAASPSGPGVAFPEPGSGLVMGHAGVAKTTLRPSGKALFDGEMLDVVSQGEFIPAGATVRVVQVEGARVVVEAA